MVDYVAFANDPDVPVTKSMVTMLAPLVGGLFNPSEGRPKLKFAENIVMIGVWTPESEADCDPEIMAQCLELQPSCSVLVCNLGVEPHPVLLRSDPIVVRTVNDGNKDRALIVEGIEQARARGEASTSPVFIEETENAPVRLKEIYLTTFLIAAIIAISTSVYIKYGNQLGLPHWSQQGAQSFRGEDGRIRPPTVEDREENQFFGETAEGEAPEGEAVPIGEGTDGRDPSD